MGVVYRALDPVLNRHVAIKLMSQGIAADAELRDRFMREARAAGSLQHPNIITIFDFGEVDGHLFIAMEYIEGADLSEIIERRDPLPLTAKLDIVIDVLHALNYAHSRHVVHRDIKPANIRVSVEGRGKLMDFGIARLEDSTLTKSGMLIGTPNYMAPEQVTSGQVSPATDIFSLGVVLHEFLTYRTVFGGDTLHAVLYKIVSENPPSLRGTPGVPDAVAQILEKALAKDPQARYPAAAAMAQALSAARTALSGGSEAVTIHSRKTPLMTMAPPGARSRRRAGWALAAAGTALLLGAAIWTTVSLRRGATTQAPVPLAPAGPPSPAATAQRQPAPAPSRADAGARPAPAAAASGARAEAAPAQAEPRRDAVAAAPGAAAAVEQAAPGAATPAAAPAPGAAVLPAPPPAPPAAPAPAAPQPAAVPTADIEQLIAAYARAIELRSVAEIRRVYPGLTGPQQQNWEQFFPSVRSVRARLAITRLDASGSSADLSVSGSYEYNAGGRTVQQPVTFRATAVFENGAWRLQTVR